MWDRDDDSAFIPVDMVDEFLFDFNDAPGRDPRIVSVDGIREDPKSR